MKKISGILCFFPLLQGDAATRNPANSVISDSRPWLDPLFVSAPSLQLRRRPTHRFAEQQSTSAGETDGKREADSTAVAAPDDGLTAQERMALLLGKSVNDDGAAAAREREREAAVEALNVERRENMRVALGSGLGGALLYGGQRLNPLRADPLVILREMERDSPPVDAQLFTNGRPTVIDFYAPWCENCKTMAPSMRTIEKEYSGRVNFVTVDGSRSDTSSQRLVQRFRVDAIPHIALVSARGEILTALIGLIPKEVLKADFDALLSDRPLPYIGYDAFDGDVTRSAVDQGW